MTGKHCQKISTKSEKEPFDNNVIFILGYQTTVFVLKCI